MAIKLSELFSANYNATKWLESGLARVVYWSGSSDRVASNLPLTLSERFIVQGVIEQWDSALGSLRFEYQPDPSKADLVITRAPLGATGDRFTRAVQGSLIRSAEINFGNGVADFGLRAVHLVGNVLGLGDIYPTSSFTSVMELPLERGLFAGKLTTFDVEIIRQLYSEVGPHVLCTLSSPRPIVSEGQTAVIQINVGWLSPGTSVNYRIDGLSASDLAGFPLQGLLDLGASGSAQLFIPVTSDERSEGEEILSITVLGERIDITVRDTSVRPQGQGISGGLPISFGVKLGVEHALLLDQSQRFSSPNVFWVRDNDTWTAAFRDQAARLLMWHQQSPSGNRVLDGLSLADALAALLRGLQGPQGMDFVDLIGQIGEVSFDAGMPVLDRSFLTTGSTTDRIEPTLVRIYPGQLALVPSDQVFVLEFDEIVVLTNPRGISLYGPGGKLVPCEVSTFGCALVIDPVGILQTGASYRLEVLADSISDLWDNRYDVTCELPITTVGLSSWGGGT